MTAEEMRAKIYDLQREKDNIYAQVAEARRLAAQEGIYSDAKWLTAAEVAMKIRGRQIGMLQQQLGKLVKQERAEKHKDMTTTFERTFLHVARDTLPHALYLQLLDEARRIAEA